MAKVLDLFGRELRPDEEPRSRLSTEGRRLAAELGGYSLNQLVSMYGALTKVRNLKGPKAFVRDMLADLLDFRTQERFDTFFETLSPMLRDAVRSAAFASWIGIEPLETKYGVQIVLRSKARSYFQEQFLNPAAGADLFLLGEGDALILPPPLRRVFAGWLPKPECYYLHPAENPEGEEWSNADAIRELISLLVEAAEDGLKGMDVYEAARKGLTKGAIKKARAACGQKPFSVAGSLGLDSIDLFARAVKTLTDAPVRRVSEGDEFIKGLVDKLFSDESTRTSYRYSARSGLLEYYVLIDHLTRRPGVGLDTGLSFPSSRTVLRRILGGIAAGGSWYSVEDLLRYIAARGEPFFFCDAASEREYLRLKGERLQVDGRVWEADSYEAAFYPVTRLRDSILGFPLLKAYCYLLAVLGVLEIRETEPTKPLTAKGRAMPISPYDGLAYVRVTEFGAWCLGIRAEKPERPAAAYEAVADRDLLLITFKGHSLERRLYLESIGDRLGTDRYRITEASFVRGCEAKVQIEARIRKFKTLIEPAPSPRWNGFFAAVLSRASLFSDPEPALLFSLPDDPAVKRYLAEEPRLRGLAVKAEGNRVVVRQQDHRKFLKILAEGGFFNPER